MGRGFLHRLYEEQMRRRKISKSGRRSGFSAQGKFLCFELRASNFVQEAGTPTKDSTQPSRLLEDWFDNGLDLMRKLDPNNMPDTP